MKARIYIVFLALFLVWGRSSCLSVSPTIVETPTVIDGVEEPVVMLPNSEVEVESEKRNLTEPKDEATKSRLEKLLDEQKVGGWNGINTLRKMIRWAIARGVPANTIVLIFLLPLIATIVSIMHYILGLTGYGIFTPTMMAVTLLNTGIAGGLLLFLAILGMSLVGRIMTSKLKLHYWPSRSINLLIVSLVTAMLMFGSSYLRFLDISQISIFPILFMIMLSEDFVRTQLAKSKKEAKRLTIGTLALSVFGAVLMDITFIQEKVLLYPEAAIVIVLLVNLLVGNYRGIRASEFRRFAKAIRN